MSVFTSSVTETIKVPHDPGQTVTIRKLNPRQLKAAQRESQVQAIKLMEALGGPSFLKEIRDLDPDKVEEAKAADPLMVYDSETLIARGVISWTYAEAPSAETIEDLDEQTQTWLAAAILKLAKPELYDKGAQKNG